MPSRPVVGVQLARRTEQAAAKVSHARTSCRSQATASPSIDQGTMFAARQGRIDEMRDRHRGVQAMTMCDQADLVDIRLQVACAGIGRLHVDRGDSRRQVGAHRLQRHVVDMPLMPHVPLPSCHMAFMRPHR
jgi:hypothetical protein